MTNELKEKIEILIYEDNLEEIKKILNKNTDIDNSLLLYASRRGCYNIVDYFTNLNLDLNYTDNIVGRSAISEAAFKGHLDILKLLINKGANINQKSFAANPLFAAIYKGHVEIAKYLIEQGIDLTVTYHIGDIENCNAMEYARQYGRTEIYEYLKEKMKNK